MRGEIGISIGVEGPQQTPGILPSVTQDVFAAKGLSGIKLMTQT